MKLGIPILGAYILKKDIIPVRHCFLYQYAVQFMHLQNNFILKFALLNKNGGASASAFCFPGMF